MDDLDEKDARKDIKGADDGPGDENLIEDGSRGNYG